MHKHFTRSTVAVALVALVGCTSLRVVMDVDDTAGPAPATLTRTLMANDALILTKFDGSRVALHFTALSLTSIDGIDDQSSARLSILLSQVKRIERHEFDGVKTTFLVVAIAAGLYMIAEAVAEASLASSI